MAAPEREARSRILTPACESGDRSSELSSNSMVSRRVKRFARVAAWGTLGSGLLGVLWIAREAALGR